jgi:hypothetical protein
MAVGNIGNTGFNIKPACYTQNIKEKIMVLNYGYFYAANSMPATK